MPNHIMIRRILPWFDLKTFTKFIGGNFTYQLVTILSELWILKFIDIERIGLWQYALLLQSYVIISRLGIINAFNRDYPYLKASRENEYAEKIIQTASFHVILSMIAQSLFFLCLALFYLSRGENRYLVITLFVMVAYTALDAASNFEEAKLRAVLEFNKISIAKIALSVFSLLLLVLPYYFEYVGLLVRVLLVQIFLVILYKATSKNKIKSAFSLTHWATLFSDGWKIWAWSYLNTFTKTLPRLYISTFCGFGVLGLFAPINWMILAFTLFTASLSEFVYPNLTQRFAKGDKNLPKQSLLISAIAFGAAIPFAIIGYLLLPTLIVKFLPKYSLAIAPMQIVLIASVLDIFTLSSSTWVAMKDWTRMWVFVIVNLAIRISSLAWLYLKGADSLVNLSISMVVASVFTLLLVLTLVFEQDAKIKKKAAILSI